MRDRLRGLGPQCLAAFQEASRLALPPAYQDVRQVVVSGMGGSAVGGDLLGGLAHQQGTPVPIGAWRDSRLPAWVGPQTLVIASSYSGDTRETLLAFEDALHKGARLVALTSGGRLGALARHHRVPLLEVPYRGEPRTALGYSFVAPLALLSGLGLFPDCSAALQEAAKLLEQMAAELGEEIPERANPAKALARRLWGRLPVVYGGGFLAGVARRWKTELNENAKTWALAEALPEAVHNSVQAFSLPTALRRHVTVVFLRPRLLPAELQAQYGPVRELLAQAGIPTLEVECRGGSPLAHLLTAAYVGSWTSYYLALLYRRDPSPTPAIAALKARHSSA
jgi:glucose/mannose-6-phosphate isomerase